MNKKTSHTNRRSAASGKGRTFGRQQNRSSAKTNKEWLHKPIVWIVGVVTSVLITVLAGVLTGVLTPLTRALFQPGSAASPRLPVPQHDLCSKYNIGVQCTLNVLASGALVTKKPFSSYQTVPACFSPAMSEWTNKNTFPPETRLLLEISSSTRAAVNIANLQASVIKRYPPLRTAMLLCAGGETYSLYVNVNLDTTPPTVKYRCGNFACAFPTFTLQKGDVIKIYVFAGSSKHLMEWRGHFNLIVNGRAYALSLGNHYVTPELFGHNYSYCQYNGPTWKKC